MSFRDRTRELRQVDSAQRPLRAVPDSPADPFDSSTGPNGSGPNGYGRAALADEADRVRGAAVGTRNHTLNLAAFKLGQLVAAGHLHDDEVVQALTAAAGEAGLTGHEIRSTIASGLSKGRTHPRTSAAAARHDSRPTVESAPVDRNTCHATFTRWLGDSYDLLALDAVLACAAVEQLGGDPPWLLVVSGSGAAKTETVAALAGAGAHVTSTIASEGALLSATARRDRAKDATGGLLRKVGERGLVVIKDFTSIISMSRDARAAVLAALREVHDGRWERNVGADGGRTLTWTGRLVLIGAVTTAYDSAHTVIAAMGARFALVRLDSTTTAGRLAAGRQALTNVDNETLMRAELAAAAGGLLAGIDPTAAVLDPADHETLLQVANLVTLARTAVERDYRGDVVDAHAPEMPTRFAKTLGQLMRGALAIGASRERALAVALRVASDSMPPLRRAVLTDLATNSSSRTGDVRRRLRRPYNTVDRELQALHLLGLLDRDEAPEAGWLHRLADHIDPAALSILSSICGTTRTQCTPRSVDQHVDEATVRPVPAKAGTQDPLPAATQPDGPDLPDASCRRCGFPLDSHGHHINCPTGGTP